MTDFKSPDADGEIMNQIGPIMKKSLKENYIQTPKWL